MYSFSGRIRYSEVDETGTLSIVSLLNYFQDCSLFQTQSFGYGPAHVEEVGLRWMVSTWQIEIDRLPKFCDAVTVSTWLGEFKGLFASREFTMADEAGGLIVRANSQWFMFDDSVGKPIRPPQSETAPYADDIANDKPLDIVHMSRKIAVPEGGIDAEAIVVTPAHIDTNHHVNNAQYVDIALGALPRGIEIRKLDVQYIAAAHLGDVVYPRVHELPDGRVVSLNGADGKPYAVVRVR